MRIKYCKTSISLTVFRNLFLSKWRLEQYTNVNVNEPTIFFGVYNADDYSHIINHKSLAVVVWGGSDSMASPELLATLNLPHIKHISGSKWITQDLQRAGIDSVYLPISCVDGDKAQMKALPLGECIYVYTAEGQTAYNYGKEYYDSLMQDYGTGIFYIATAKSYGRDQLYSKVIPNCFIGLRLLKHDGLSETVSELGLMGRRVIYNGCEPNALNYTCYEDIKEHIENEKKYIGQTFPDISKKMREFLNIGENWLNTEFWK